MNLGVQYYRAPFPDEKYWEDDFIRIKNSGLNTVQLWVLWGWVEAKPGRFCFDDYDRLVELAHKKGLGVILSTIAEIQPYWIHREVPGSEMVDHTGKKVVSSNREECHFGLTPGGCTDHPGVWERMQIFLKEVVVRYRGAENLRGWDAWNELRWNVNSDGLVCFCDYTLIAFRKWLEHKFGGLDELNKIWKRRYGCWEELLPGKLPDRPYTEMMAFEHFITWRANQHGKRRYDLMKYLDPKHPVTVHAASPSPLTGGWENDHAINRGNDWFYADDLDGVGCSSFPKWAGMDDAEFGVRVEYVKSASQGKLVWLSEVQGGRASTGFTVHQPVDAKSQQRYTWNGIACGADTILFWCWRDEVFGRESAGFGISGDDGFAEERLSAMKITGKILEDNSQLISNYKPIKPEVGVFFSPQAYYLNWAQERNANRAMRALQGYSRSLVRMSIPYTVVEEEHLNALEDLKILFMPRAIVTDENTEKSLTTFVENGGTLVCESECGAFNSQGFYRYPVDRFTAKLSGIREVGRRSLDSDVIRVKMDDEEFNLGVTQWLTPWQKGKGKVFSENRDGSLILEVSVGKGKLILCGAYLGDAYLQKWTPDFERFIQKLVLNSGWKPTMEVLSPLPAKDSFVYIKSGESAGKKMIFVFFPDDHDEVHLRFNSGFFNKAKDLISGKEILLKNTSFGQECLIIAPEWRFSLLVESA